MTRRTAGVVMAAMAVAVIAAGCTKASQGTATPSTTDTTAATAALWDPCTQISSDVLQKLGVDQSSKESGIGGVQQSGWKICSWSYPPEHNQSVTIYSTIHTIDEFKKKSENTDFVSVSVDGRAGWKFHRATDKDNEICDLVFPFTLGVGSYQISFGNLDPGMTSSPCEGATNAAKVLVAAFPG